MKELLIEKLYNFWIRYDKFYKIKENNLKQNLENAINNGEQGAEELLDWCREEFEYFQNGTYKEMEEELNRIWDICNWYLDYTQGIMTESKLLNLIKD